MTGADLGALGVVGFFALLGFRRGGLDMAASLAALAVGLGTALVALRPLAAAFPLGPTPGASGALWFLIVFAVLQVGLATLFSRALHRRFPDLAGRIADRLLGLVPGALEGALVAALLALVLLLAPQGLVGADELAEGRVTGPLLRVGGAMQSALHEEFGSGVRELLGMGPPIGVPDRRYPLPRTSHGEREPAAEEELFERMNGARRDAGLPLFEREAALDEVARAHAEDMWRRGYFGHADPEGHDVVSRVEARGVAFGVVGENLALAPTAQVAHRGLMDSAGHRANLLSPKFRRAGVGAVRGPTGATFVQVFRD